MPRVLRSDLAILLVLPLHFSCYGSATEARTHQTAGGSGFRCSVLPIVKCGGTECSGWDEVWQATCPADGARFTCKFAGASRSIECRQIAEPARTHPVVGVPQQTANSTFDEAAPGGYKNLTWGMSTEQLRTLVPDTTTSEAYPNQLRHTTTVAGNDATVFYSFVTNRLSSVGIMFRMSFSDANQYVREYVRLKLLLKKKYGTPSLDLLRWSQGEDIYSKNWGLAVSIGYLKFHARWHSKFTTVGLHCAGQNHETSVFLLYSSRALEKQETEQSDQRRLKDL